MKLLGKPLPILFRRSRFRLFTYPFVLSQPFLFFLTFFNFARSLFALFRQFRGVAITVHRPEPVGQLSPVPFRRGRFHFFTQPLIFFLAFLFILTLSFLTIYSFLFLTPFFNVCGTRNALLRQLGGILITVHRPKSFGEFRIIVFRGPIHFLEQPVVLPLPYPFPDFLIISFNLRFVFIIRKANGFLEIAELRDRLFVIAKLFFVPYFQFRT